MSLRELRVRPLMYAAAALFVGVTATVEESGEWLRWRQLQQKPVETTATVLSDQVLIRSSGGAAGRVVTYEFVAPGNGSDGGARSEASGGSTTSAAEVQALLEEEFFGTGDGAAEASPAAAPVQLAEGELFFRGEQTIRGDDYRRVDTSGPIRIMYAQSEPANSAIIGTNAAPSVPPLLIGLAALGGGLWFLWQGVKYCFRQQQRML